MHRTTLYMHEAGPLIRYLGGMLIIETLNPETKVKWRMSRLDMVKMGWCCIVAGVRAPSPERQAANLKAAFAENGIPWPEQK